MVILGGAYIIRSATGQARDLLLILGKNRLNLYISCASIIICFAAMAMLVPVYGVAGASIAMVIVYILRTIAFTLLINRETGYWVLVKPFGAKST
jgi:O-antigen/teichoic acid export membrane protein